jgi:hypothetical protein
MVRQRTKRRVDERKVRLIVAAIARLLEQRGCVEHLERPDGETGFPGRMLRNRRVW